MNSTTSLVARQYRLNQWAEQIRDCQNRPDGMAVSEWCSLHGIIKASYYYRLKQVHKACLETVSKEKFTQSIVPVPQEIMAPAAQTPSAPGVDISVNGFCIHVAESTSPELLTKVLKVAAHVEWRHMLSKRLHRLRLHGS
ncbi:MAG: IS66 family insertion sequence element accessory protein TnpB [Acetatifactor sp.]|nr:IS66 family insertion sequence element accessory protein TnpB [Acetatifactor sp.]